MNIDPKKVEKIDVTADELDVQGNDGICTRDCSKYIYSNSYKYTYYIHMWRYHYWCGRPNAYASISL